MSVLQGVEYYISKRVGRAIMDYFQPYKDCQYHQRAKKSLSGCKDKYI